MNAVQVIDLMKEAADATVAALAVVRETFPSACCLFSC
jgi:hypothetical protein